MATLKIIFFDINPQFINAYQNVLSNKIKDSMFVCKSLEELIRDYPNINAIVSPANSYGIMNGGIDKYINELLDNIEPKVQQKISEVGVYDNSGRKYLPVGKCLVVPKGNLLLFVAPTMIMPMKLDPTSQNIMVAFYAILINAFSLVKMEKNIVIACPCLGTGVGKFDPCESAKQVLAAYMLLKDQ